ncbi:MAG: molybdopterin cofactor-binding domain-containing protein, partial [Melioribacteraceae bacterium]|nr:molybdopterin cofactor-binding domain-containing protein [Melioribacteraceae bacterium]
MSIKKSKYFFEEDIVETIGEVSDEKYEPLPDNKDLNIIGKRIPRYDGYKKVSGLAKYTYDLSLPNMAHAKFVRSPLPNAIIKNIDVNGAKKIKGVLDIMTYEDVKNIEWYDGNSHLLDKRLRHEGDEIAFVVAENEKLAADAIKEIKIEFEELKFSTTAEEALSETAYQNYEWGNLLEGKPDTYERGNVEDGFEGSDEIVDGTFTTPIVIHNPTEVHCSLAKWDGDKLTVWDSTQGIYSVREEIASVMEMPEEN